LLEKHAEEIPPNLISALKSWDKKGVQAKISSGTVLRLGSPAILKALMKTPAKRFILEQLGPTAVIVKDGSEGKLSQALVEMGYLLEVADFNGSQV
jgi:hypothetical protein